MSVGKKMLTEKEAIELLQEAANKAGSPSKLAEELSVSRNFVSLMLRGQRAITGAVADHLKLKAHKEVVRSYEYTG